MEVMSSSIIFSIVSVLGSTGALVFAALFLVFLWQKKHKKAIVFLVFAMLFWGLAIFFKTDSIKMFNIIVSVIGMSFIPIGLLVLFSGKWKVSLAAIALGVLFIVSLYSFGVLEQGGSSYSGSKTCKVCHKSFSDSANKNSIGRTNMCKDCYRNFEFGMKSTGRW